MPSNKTGVNRGVSKENKGNVLRGQMILEVPVQKKADIPPNVLEYANSHRITIRDIKDKYYN